MQCLGEVMQIKLFGGFRLLDRRAREVNVPLKRARALLAYLALRQSRAESREVIVDLLWPDRFKEQARASLRQVLFELRKLSSPNAPIVAATRDEVAIGPGIEICDVWAFENIAASNDLDDAEELLRLYGGPLLDGPSIGSEPVQQWAALQRARLESQLESAVLHATAGNGDEVAGARICRLLDHLVRLSPMCCQAVLRLMEISADNDRAADALRHYERYANRLKLEFGEDPPAELSDAYATLKSAPTGTAKFPRPRRRLAYSRLDPWRRTSNDAPVVAVLPFRYKGTKQSGDALAMALGEDVTMMLSGCRWFSVLSRSATHNLQPNESFVPSDFARRTGADYLIYGTILDRAEAWSVAVELADAESGYINWAKRFDTTDGDILSWGGEVCPLIVAALDPAVAESEHKSLRRPVVAATGSEIAYQHLVVGYRNFYSGAWAEALAAFRNAAREDATYAHAHAMLAITTYYAAQIHRGAGWNGALKSTERSARRALEIDPSEPKACNILGQVLDWQGRHDESLAHLDQAAQLNPSFAAASTARSYHAVMVGAFDDAKAHIQTAMRLRVGDAGLGLCLPAKALADLHLGNTTEALQTAHWAARLKPNFWLTRQVLAACLWASDNIDAAKDAVAALRTDYHGVTSDEFSAWFPYADQRLNQPIKDALRGAGWH
jgi:DNA-binding SARP family transcriptional activator/Flp pilus assembly protein TadD